MVGCSNQMFFIARFTKEQSFLQSTESVLEFLLERFVTLS